MQEINAAGGVLGRRLAILVKDHRGNPARGIDNMAAFAARENLVAVMGGLHTPVALAELDTVHRHDIVFLIPWAAGTPVVENDRTPNYVFRVSVRDEFAGPYLIDHALALGYRSPALLLERTGWGKSNYRAMHSCLQDRGLLPAAVEWFSWGVRTLTPQLRAAIDAGADVVILVANAPEGIVAVQTMAGLPSRQRLPVVSHWGITGGDFFSQAATALKKVELQFLQTFSFLQEPEKEKTRRFLSACYRLTPGCSSPRCLPAPVGTAHAYDLVHLLCLAIETAGTTSRSAVRDALEHLPRWQGLVRTYDPPFTPARHDALTAADYSMGRYDTDGAIIPVRSIAQ